jgi:hypothetical protein
MTTSELTPAILESRNIVSDCNRMAERIEAYRTRKPHNSPHLLVQQSEKIAPAKHCLPEIPATEFDLVHLRAAVADHGGLIVRNLFPQTSVDALI